MAKRNFEADPTAAARVGAHVQIQDVQLVYSLFRFRRLPTDDELTSLHSEWSARVDRRVEGTFAVEAGFRLVPAHADGQLREQSQDMPNEDDAVVARARFRLEYTTSGRTRSEDLEHFAWINGVFNAWPYWRQLMQTMSSAMGLPPIVVPVFRLPMPTSAAKVSSPKALKAPKETAAASDPSPSPRSTRTLPKPKKPEAMPDYSRSLEEVDI